MRRASFVRAFSVLSFAAAALASAPAFAQGSSAATAEHLFNEGLAAMKRNDYAAACESFAGSNEAEESPGTEINLAVCSEKQGKLASAWGWYLKAAPLANRKGQKERAELARNEAARLEPLLHKMVITVKVPVEGMTVTRDGVKVPAAVLGKEDPVDPGEHVVEVTAPKKRPNKQKTNIPSTPGVTRIEVPALEDAPVDAPVGPVGTTAPPATGGSDGTTQRVLGIIATSAGLLCGIPVGIYAATTISEDNAADRALEAADKPENAANRQVFLNNAKERRDNAKSNQTGVIAFSVVGGVLLIGGVILILTAPSSSSAKAEVVEKPGVKPMPIVGNGSYGFGLSGTF